MSIFKRQARRILSGNLTRIEGDFMGNVDYKHNDCGGGGSNDIVSTYKTLKSTLVKSQTA